MKLCCCLIVKLLPNDAADVLFFWFMNTSVLSLLIRLAETYASQLSDDGGVSFLGVG